MNSLKPLKKTAMVFVIDRALSRLLMIKKKKGQGEGLYNVPGGKLKELETSEQAARRECQEETGLLPGKLEFAGHLKFVFPKESKHWSNECDVFRSYDWSGSIVAECAECTCHWIDISKIPYDLMWEDDRHWIPRVFEGEKFELWVEFNHDGKVVKQDFRKI